MNLPMLALILLAAGPDRPALEGRVAANSGRRRRPRPNRFGRDDKPVPGAMVGLVQASRSSRSFLGDTPIGTGPDGRFSFSNIHADEGCFLYGIMGSFPDGGAVAVSPVRDPPKILREPEAR